MQTVSNSFNQKAAAGVRKHRWGLLMSFDKEFDDSRGFFILDSSLIGGQDLITPVGDSPIQFWDFYSYDRFQDRVIDMSWERESEFPYSVQSSVASVTLNNYDGYFSEDGPSPISNYLVPGRPTKLLAGYEGEALLQQFVGLTQGSPVVDNVERTAQFESLDYLSEIFKLDMYESIALSNVRTDEALVALFDQFGIESYQYDLSRGRNVIPFLFIEAGRSAADVVRDIMQAEGGKLWIDEQGVIRFDPRIVPDKSASYRFDESSISEIGVTEDSGVINRVKIISKIRQVQQKQIVHSSSTQIDQGSESSKVVIPALSTATYSFDLPDPLGSYTVPTLGQVNNDSWFRVVNSSGGNVSANVSVIEARPSMKNMEITFANTNGYPVTLEAIEVWGQPARVVDTINYEAFDQSSIDAYGEHPLEIENDMFGSESNCESFAFTVIDAQAQPNSTIEATVKGNYASQMGDIIEVDTPRISGAFEITGMSNSISGDGIVQSIKARRYNTRPWFILNQSILNEQDILAP